MTDKPDREPDMDFATTLMEMAHGEVNNTLSHRLAELVEAVEETGKAGALTLKIGVKKEGTMAVVHADVSCKLPEHPMPGTMFFFGEVPGELRREDPRQLTLREIVTPQPLRSVEGDDE